MMEQKCVKCGEKAHCFIFICSTKLIDFRTWRFSVYLEWLLSKTTIIFDSGVVFFFIIFRCIRFKSRFRVTFRFNLLFRFSRSWRRCGTWALVLLINLLMNRWCIQMCLMLSKEALRWSKRTFKFPICFAVKLICFYKCAPVFRVKQCQIGWKLCQLVEVWLIAQ